MRRIIISLTIGSIGGILWFVGLNRLTAERELARAPLWPRPDGSVHSFGEVWDHAGQLRSGRAAG